MQQFLPDIVRTASSCAPAAAVSRIDDTNVAFVGRPLHSSVPPLLPRAWVAVRSASNNDFIAVKSHGLHACCTGPLGFSSGATCVPLGGCGLLNSLLNLTRGRRLPRPRPRLRCITVMMHVHVHYAVCMMLLHN